MTSGAYLSFIVSPILFLVIGWAAVFYHRQSTRRFDFESNTKLREVRTNSKELVSANSAYIDDRIFGTGKNFFDEEKYKIDLSRSNKYNIIDNPYLDNPEKFFIQKTIWTEFGKRLFDIIVSSFLITFLVPVFIIISLIIKTDGGPALFSHPRVGRGGAMFSCFRFRIVYTNHKEIIQKKILEDKSVLTEFNNYGFLRNDPRITKFGRFLYRASLDELPQLFNVLRGDMSLVGPRPVLRDVLENHYGPVASSIYLSVRPGITSADYSLYESNYSYVMRINSDAFYVTHMSFTRDMRTIGRTIVNVFYGREYV